MIFGDIYCAICGGPFRNVEIFQKAKSARARRKQNRDSGLVENAKENTNTSHNYHDDDDRKSNGMEIEFGYDAEIINEEETKWVETLHILGFNKNAPGISK